MAVPIEWIWSAVARTVSMALVSVMATSCTIPRGHAHLGLLRSPLPSGSGCPDPVVGAGLEPLPTTVRAEGDGAPVFDDGCRRVRRLDLHPADRVDRMVAADPQPVPVPVGPVEEAEQGQEDDVEVRRVVPLEVR